MDKVEEKVDDIRQTLSNRRIEASFVLSADEIPYAMVFTNDQRVPCLFWLITCLKDRLNRENVLVQDIYFLNESHSLAYVNKCQNILRNGNNLCPYKSSQSICKLFVTGEPSRDAAEYPDQYITPGDIICSKIPSPGLNLFSTCFSHDGIFIGNAEVAHVSGHEGKKNESVARIGQICPNFVLPGQDISIRECRYLFRSPQKVLEIARQCAENNFREGEFNIFFRNCQHFALFCAVGFDYSVEASPALEIILNNFIRMVSVSVAGFLLSSFGYKLILIIVTFLIILFFFICALVFFNNSAERYFQYIKHNFKQWINE